MVCMIKHLINYWPNKMVNVLVVEKVLLLTQLLQHIGTLTTIMLIKLIAVFFVIVVILQSA